MSLHSLNGTTPLHDHHSERMDKGVSTANNDAAPYTLKGSTVHDLMIARPEFLGVVEINGYVRADTFQERCELENLLLLL